MNISNILVNLTGSDILSIINDFVKVEGLTLNSVDINNGIIIDGSFKKGIKVNFKGKIEDISIENGKINCRFSSLKVYKLGIFKVFRSIGLKFILKFIGDLGIDANKDILIIDVDKILKNVPFIKLRFNSLYIKENKICADINDIKLNLGEISNKKDSIEEKDKVKDTIEHIDAEEVSLSEIGFRGDEDHKESYSNYETHEKVDDYYSKGRDLTKEKIINATPDNIRQYSDYVFILPDILALVCRLLKDDRVPMKTKIAVSGSIAYIVCPSDLIPKNIPFVGKIDDLAALFFALNRIAKDIPIEVIIENWSGKDDLIIALKNGLEYVTNFTGARNIEKIFDVVDELSGMYKEFK